MVAAGVVVAIVAVGVATVGVECVCQFAWCVLCAWTCLVVVVVV